MATALVSDPPRPSVATRPSSLTPWKPGMTAMVQCFVEGRVFNRFDPRIAVDSAGADQLPAHEAAGLGAHRLEGHGKQSGGDLFAAGDHDIIFARIVERRGLAAILHQPVGFPGHCRDHHQYLIAGLRLALDPRGDGADALDPRHRRAAEFHHDAGHKRCGCSLG